MIRQAYLTHRLWLDEFTARTLIDILQLNIHEYDEIDKTTVRKTRGSKHTHKEPRHIIAREIVKGILHCDLLIPLHTE